MKNTFQLVMVICASLTSAIAFADTSYQATVNFENPNGCRAWDRVVEPDCDGDVAPARCDDAQKAIKALGAPMLKVHCARLHTGNTAERLLQEAFMGTSYDGYKLEVTARNAHTGDATQLTVPTPGAATCADAEQVVTALAQQGLKASAVCDAGELRVQFGK